MNCPKCSAQVKEGNKFCNKCGFRLNSAVSQTIEPDVTQYVCLKCGKPVGHEDKFCKECGFDNSQTLPHDAGVAAGSLEIDTIPEAADYEYLGEAEAYKADEQGAAMSQLESPQSDKAPFYKNKNFIPMCCCLTVLLSVTAFFSVQKSGDERSRAAMGFSHNLPQASEAPAIAASETAEAMPDLPAREATPAPELTAALVIRPQYNALNGGFDEYGRARVKIGNFWHLIDRMGNIVTDYGYDAINFFYDDLAVVVRNGRYGYIDVYGNEIIPPQFDNAASFSEEIAFVTENGKFAYIDKVGWMLTAPVFSTAKRASDGYVVVSPGDKRSYFIDISILFSNFMDTNSALLATDELLSVSFEDAKSFSEGLAAVRNNGKWGYVDASFNYVIRPQFDEAYEFTDGSAVVEQNGLQFHIDSNGNRISPECDQVWNFSDGYATALLSGKYGFIDRDTEEFAIFPTYEDAWAFDDGLAPVSAGKGGWYYINKDDEPQFGGQRWDEAHKFNGGVAKIQTDGKWGFIDTAGNEIIPAIWDDAHFCAEEMIGVCDNGKWGFYSVNADEVGGADTVTPSDYDISEEDAIKGAS